MNLEEGHIYVAEETVTAAEMQALATTPKLMVAAPGAGKALYAVWFSVEMLGATSFGGVGAGDDFTLRNTDNSGDLWGTIETTGFLTLTTLPKRLHYVPHYHRDRERFPGAWLRWGHHWWVGLPGEGRLQRCGARVAMASDLLDCR